MHHADAEAGNNPSFRKKLNRPAGRGERDEFALATEAKGKMICVLLPLMGTDIFGNQYTTVVIKS